MSTAQQQTTGNYITNNYATTSSGSTVPVLNNVSYATSNQPLLVHVVQTQTTMHNNQQTPAVHQNDGSNPSSAGSSVEICEINEKINANNGATNVNCAKITPPSNDIDDKRPKRKRISKDQSFEGIKNPPKTPKSEKKLNDIVGKVNNNNVFFVENRPYNRLNNSFTI